jgi:hypothetical protein
LGHARCKTDNAHLNYLLPNEELNGRLIVKRSLNPEHQFIFNNQTVKKRTTNSKIETNNKQIKLQRSK